MAFLGNGMWRSFQGFTHNRLILQNESIHETVYDGWRYNGYRILLNGEREGKCMGKYEESFFSMKEMYLAGCHCCVVYLLPNHIIFCTLLYAVKFSYNCVMKKIVE